MKNNERYAFKHIFGEHEQWTYSQQAAEFVVSEIKKSPDTIIDKLKRAKEKR